MLRPLVAPEPENPPTPTTGDETVGHAEAPEEPSQTKDTFSRAADWLRRLGKIRDEEPAEPRNSPTIGETVQAAREKGQESSTTGDDTIALPIFDKKFAPERADAPRPSSRGQLRFVLKVSDGRQFTIGESPGGIGSRDDYQAPDGGVWQWVHLPGEESIDPVHLFFGNDNGVLWVSDQRTVFGTVVIEPGQDPIQCIPEERYFLVRGSEIYLGGLAITVH